MKKELPKPIFDSGKLFMLPYEALKWELLKSAIELNMFDLLGTPTSALEIAEKLSLHPANTEYMLDALVAMGCLTKTNNRYTNTHQTEQFLTTGKDTSLGSCLLFMSNWTMPGTQWRVERTCKKWARLRKRIWQILKYGKRVRA